MEKDGKWMLPGGRLEDNETWLEGLQREVKEQTGIENFSIEKILYADTSESGKTYIVTFLCKIGSSEVRLSNEHQKYSWINEKEIDKYQFWHEKIRERLLKLAQNKI